ncbi:MAG: TIGR03986 family CRISPR-associated RAMP protein [Calditrichaeota bacterium]|nr:MAG: TIGR03986 family CRISPR-associated RAMP protein [Calditrichota bacterium]
MHLPTHKNPTLNAECTASAPYNFIPLPENLVKAVENANDLPDQNQFHDKRKSGYFDVTLNVMSPLYVRHGLPLKAFLKQEDEAEKNKSFRKRIKNKPEFFYTQDKDNPVIPGSSLRGMLRHFLEAVSYGKFDQVMNSPKVFIRAVAAEGDDPLKQPYIDVIGNMAKKVQAGYLIKHKNEWFIQPARRPSNENLRGEGAFLKLKEEYIENGAIPGLLRLNDSDYKPQYYDIFFDADTVEGQDGRPRTKMTNIGTADNNQSHSGVLVCTGNMKETGGETESPRKTFAIVLPPDSKAKSIPIHPQAIKDYCDALTDFQKEDPFKADLGVLKHRRPVFYVNTPDQICYFGHCPNFRIPDIGEPGERPRTPADFVPQELRNPTDIDYADAIFGYTKAVKEKGKKRAYASRISVGDAKLVEGQSDIWLPQKTIVPPVLASPKPTTFQHYLTQKNSNNKARLFHYGSKPVQETVIRGYKFYWHKAKDKDPAKNDFTKQINETPENLRKIEDEVKETQHTQFEPVKPGTAFSFRIRFENLSDRELGALCWALHPFGEENQDYCHHLGMGKPFGMGSVKLTATLHLTDRVERYTNLFKNEGWHSGETESAKDLSDRVILQNLVMPFENHVMDVLKPDCQNMHELERIGMLLKMHEWPGYAPKLQLDKNNRVFDRRPNTRYMTIELPNEREARDKNEYKNRPVLPTPAKFGTFNASAQPKEFMDFQSEQMENYKSIPQQNDSKKDLQSGSEAAAILKKANRELKAAQSGKNKTGLRNGAILKARIEKVKPDTIEVSLPKVESSENFSTRKKNKWRPYAVGQHIRMKITINQQGKVTRVDEV